MYRPRLIPLLLLKDGVLVKSLRFKSHAYVGDPVNAVRMFNDLRADELIVLDIDAYRRNRTIDPFLLRDIAEEAMMPLGIGGGIRRLEQVREIIAAGAEKVIIGSQAVARPDFVREAALEFGSSAVTVCMDVRPHRFGKERVWSVNATQASNYDPVDFAKLNEQLGAGEIIVQAVARDGEMSGYDLQLVRRVSEAVGIPVVALGGAKTLDDLKSACVHAGASAAASGSAFTYFRRRGSVLINYPGQAERRW